MPEVHATWTVDNNQFDRACQLVTDEMRGKLSEFVPHVMGKTSFDLIGSREDIERITSEVSGQGVKIKLVIEGDPSEKATSKESSSSEDL
ncbi:hypothetical protein KKC44_01320 [Patescibacteria group bacterium]|nr:hypothetical protein [Patescibacteria group bacterium]MBU2259222.1 hypothetical protein [Patescibacteria group bacterium]